MAITCGLSACKHLDVERDNISSIAMDNNYLFNFIIDA